jgi:dephospho-CoA kinase
MKKIIAIVGMCGVGKSVATEILEDLNYKKVYFGGVTMEKLNEAGLEVTPENEKIMREKLRAEYGMDAYAKILLPKINELTHNHNVVLDGLYSWDELKFLKERLGDSLTVIAVIADKKVRYNRLAIRDIRPFTNKEAIERDIAEIENIAKAGPIAYADYYIENNNDIESYKNRLYEIIEDIGKKDE